MVFTLLYGLCCLCLIAALLLSLTDSKLLKIKYIYKKMICSTAFVFAALFASLAGGTVTTVCGLMLGGFIFSWTGDLLLDLPGGKRAGYIGGLASFFCGHILYIAAFIMLRSSLFPDRAPVGTDEIVSVFAMLGTEIIAVLLLKIKLKGDAIPVLLYAIAVDAMMLTGVRTGAYVIVSGSVMFGLFIIIGCVLFILSDLILAAGIYYFRKPIKLIDKANTATYFTAQMLLASSCFLFGTIS